MKINPVNGLICSPADPIMLVLIPRLKGVYGLGWCPRSLRTHGTSGWGGFLLLEGLPEDNVQIWGEFEPAISSPAVKQTLRRRAPPGLTVLRCCSVPHQAPWRSCTVWTPADRSCWRLASWAGSGGAPGAAPEAPAGEPAGEPKSVKPPSTQPSHLALETGPRVWLCSGDSLAPNLS